MLFSEVRKKWKRYHQNEIASTKKVADDLKHWPKKEERYNIPIRHSVLTHKLLWNF